MAGERAGLPERIARIAEQFQRLNDQKGMTSAETDRFHELADLSTVYQRYAWEDAAWPLLKELPPPPTLEEQTAAYGGPCYRLSSATLETTDEDVTLGRVEAVLGWLEAVGRSRATLLTDLPRPSTKLTDPRFQLIGPSAFSTELYK